MAEAPGHRALIVATAAGTFPGSDKAAGCWVEELCAPHNAWVAAGYTVDIATPGGRAITWSACAACSRVCCARRRVR